MTKDWESWKDDITQLYESKTLKEVRDSLAARGFDASIRAYRLKLDEWEIRKNTQPRKKRRINSIEGNADLDQTSLSSAPNTSSPESPFELHMRTVFSEYGLILPEGPLELEELQILLRKLRIDSQPWYLFESMVLKWQTRSVYLEAALGISDWLSDWPIIPLLNVHGSIFQAIETNLGRDERDLLVKTYLERIIHDPRFHKGNLDVEWLLFFRDVVQAPWGAKKEMINYHNLGRKLMGPSFVQCPTFVACARLVVVEYSLETCSRVLEEGMAEGGDEVEEDQDEVKEKVLKDTRARYMEILSDCATLSDLDPHPAYYQFAIRMNKWFEERVTRKLEEVTEQLKRSQEDYQYLEMKHRQLEQFVSNSGKRTEEDLGPAEIATSDRNANNARQYGRSLSRKTGTMRHLSTWRRMENTKDRYPSLVTLTNRIFQDLYFTWRRKGDLIIKTNEYKLVPLTLDQGPAAIDERLGPDRLISLTKRMHEVDVGDRVLFTRALLNAFGDCNFHFIREHSRHIETNHMDSRIAVRWLDLYKTRDWAHAQILRDDLAGWAVSNSDINKTSLETILDYTVALIGMRLLESLQKQLMKMYTFPFEDIARRKQETIDVITWLTDHPLLLQPEDLELIDCLNIIVGRWA